MRTYGGARKDGIWEDDEGRKFFCIAEFDVTIIFIASLSPWCVFLGEI